MVRKYFGTDGIRGKANEGAMTAETALRVGMAAGRVFRRGDHRHRVVIGKDTRLSGYMLINQMRQVPQRSVRNVRDHVRKGTAQRWS